MYGIQPWDCANKIMFLAPKYVPDSLILQVMNMMYTVQENFKGIYHTPICSQKAFNQNNNYQSVLFNLVAI